MKKYPKEVIIVGIVAVTVLEVIALILGYDGIILASVIGGILGLVGWVAPQLKLKS